ncbi:hypothetical protein ACQKKK_15195 [Peribacillus sp. NPDC006672]|uniref:hypothetical protein n=1 Tax=Peribacillus sp. NPDC006672 TaxID=3390606 RepID=UPI003D0443C3
MSLENELDLREFVKNLTEKTKTSEIKWKKVSKSDYTKLLDRSITYSSIKDPFYSEGKNGIVIVGKYEKKVYYEEDQYYYEDCFFITISNHYFEERTSFLETDNENPLGFSFALTLSKLHRLIQLNTNDIKNRIDSWFD